MNLLSLLRSNMNYHNKNGFTLMELLLYISSAALFLFILSLLLSSMISARIKHQTIQEVENTGVQIMMQLTHAIRNADAVNSPASGVESDELSLSNADNNLNPIIFNTADGELHIKEAGNAPVALHDTEVAISDMHFQNTSYEGTPEIISFQFTLSKTGGRQEFNYSRTFYGSAALRQ